MAQTRLYYSVVSSGGGSAYARLFESLALCNLDQDFQNEGWEETCSGSFVVESDTPITIISPVHTAEDVIAEIDDLGEFDETDEERHHHAAHRTAVQALINTRET